MGLLQSVLSKFPQDEKKLYILGEIYEKKTISNEVISEKDERLVCIY